MNTLWYDTQNFSWVFLVFAATVVVGVGGWVLLQLAVRVVEWLMLTAEPPADRPAPNERFRHELEIYRAVSPHVPRPRLKGRPR